MKRLSGQAGLIIGQVLHVIFRLSLVVFFVAALALGLLACRLSLGPLQIPDLASRLATEFSAQGLNVRIGAAALAWAGYNKGGGEPLFLQLGEITASNQAGVILAKIPDARLVFLPSALLGGRAPILINSTDAHFAGSDVAISLNAAIHLGIGFRLASADMNFVLGPGRLGAAGNSEPISGGSFGLYIGPHDFSVTDGVLHLAPAGQSAPVARFAGAAHLDQDWNGTFTLTGDKVQAADLGAYWPQKMAIQTRSWVLGNITAGIGHDAKFTFGLRVPRDLSKVELASTTGGFLANDLTLGWIPGVTPFTSLSGSLTMPDKDTIMITANQAILGPLRVTHGAMKIVGVSHRDQFGSVTVALDGGVAGALSVLNAPPLSLLRSAPSDLAGATGTMTANVTADLPLQEHVELSDVTLRVAAKLNKVAVATPLNGFGFTNGTLDVNATTTTLSVAGTAQFAGQVAAVTAQADFKKSQPLRRFEVKSALGPQFLHRLGLDAETSMTDAVNGTMPADLLIVPGPAGLNRLTLTANLTPARFGIPVLGWSKQPGEAGSLTIVADLRDEDFYRLEQIDAEAPALSIHGTASGPRLHLSRIVIGVTQGQGDITAPADHSTPWRINLTGAALGLRAILSPAKGKAAKEEAPASTPPSGPAWQASLNFDRLSMAPAPAPELKNLSVKGAGRGSAVASAEATAMDAAGQPLDLTITPASPNDARRDFHLSTKDGGNLLRVLGAYDDLQGGDLTLDGVYGAGGAITGTMQLVKFRLLQAPALGKVLQALTIYGAAEAASGPGLEFSRAVAPFSVSNQTLTLTDARAYSASLGFTASGTINLTDGQSNLEATIVPAYALNTLPSKIPLIGKLFSAEKGGGLFAVRAKIGGTLGNPSVRVNPLSALTPGVLRDLFGGPAPVQK
jgi:hypothetical protein